MGELKITGIQAVNAEALDAALRAAMGVLCSGFSYDGVDVVTVVLDNAVTDKQLKQAQQIVERHDAKVLTEAQEAQIAAKAKLDQLNATVGKQPVPSVVDVDTAAFLLKKVDWLESVLRHAGLIE